MKPILYTPFRPVLAAVCVLVLCGMAGCSTLSDGWDTTTEYYEAYVKPTAEVDYDDPTPADEEEIRMARVFAPVDARVQHLVMFLDGQDDMPDREWVTRLFERHGWIGGVITVESSGRIVGRQPEYSLKPLPLSTLLDMEEGWIEPEVRGYVDSTPLGPEVYIYYPIMEDEDWKGLNIVHFAPEDVVEFSPAPEDLILFTPDVMLWTGENEAAAQALQGLDWADLMEDDMAGSAELDQGDYYWFIRYLGGEYLIYAVPEPAED